MIYYLISISSLFPTLLINHHFTFILHFILFSYSNFQRDHVHHDTDYSTYFEHHHAFERITRPWIYLSNLFFHWRGKILLSHTNVHGDSNIDSVFSIFSLWYEFGTNCNHGCALLAISGWVIDTLTAHLPSLSEPRLFIYILFYRQFLCRV